MRAAAARIRALAAAGASPEDVVHAAVAEVLRLSLSAGWAWWHTPNEGKRTRRQQTRLHTQGMLAGVPDILLISPAGRLHALELKRERSHTGRALRRLSDRQSDFFRALPAACPRAVAHGVVEALDVLDGWGAIRAHVTADGEIRVGRPTTDTPAPSTVRGRRVASKRAVGEQADDEIRARGRAAWAKGTGDL